MTPASATPRMLAVEDLHVSFRTPGGMLHAVDGISFAIGAGECVGIVGESGCGKSVAARSVLRLLHTAETSGRILYRRTDAAPPVDLVRLAPNSKAMRAIRGKEIAMVFQEPMTALTPVYTVGAQLIEEIRAHARVSAADARTQAIALLARVGIPDSTRRVDDYPHQLSGGMRQRVVIALALACHPQLIIADEPTTALDVTIQAQILRLLRELQHEMGMALIMITHDLAVVADMADVVVVMYLGQVVERAPAAAFFKQPKHPYAQALVRSIITPATEPQTLLPTIPGTVPNPLNAPSGCRFRTRCAFAHERCLEAPPDFSVGPEHTAKCWLYHEGGGPCPPNRS